MCIRDRYILCPLRIGESSFFSPLITFSLSRISPFSLFILLLFMSPLILMCLMCSVLVFFLSNPVTSFIIHYGERRFHVALELAVFKMCFFTWGVQFARRFSHSSSSDLTPISPLSTPLGIKILARATRLSHNQVQTVS